MDTIIMPPSTPKKPVSGAFYGLSGYGVFSTASITAWLALGNDPILTTLADGTRELVNSKGDNVVSTGATVTHFNGANKLPIASESIDGDFTVFSLFSIDGTFSNMPIVGGTTDYIKINGSNSIAIKINGVYANKAISQIMTTNTPYFMKVIRENGLVSIELNNVEVLAPYEHLGTFSANAFIGAWDIQKFQGNLSSIYIVKKAVKYDVFNNQELFLNSLVNKINVGDYPISSQFDLVPQIIPPIVSYLERFSCPSFGNTITKVTNLTDFGSHTNPYTKVQAFNSDSTYYRINERLVSVEDNTIVKLLSWMNDYRWARTDTNKIYGVSSEAQGRFASVAIDTNIRTTIREFDTGDILYDDFLLGKYEGSQDFNDEWVMFNAHNKASNDLTAILYNIKTDEVREHLFVDTWDKLDYITVSPSGQYIMMNWVSDPATVGTDYGQSIYLYDMNFNFLRELVNQGQHGDFAFNQDGKECWVAFAFSAEAGIWSYPLDGSTPTQELPSKYNGGHISGQNFNRKGYAYVSCNQEGYKEVIALKLDGSGTVERVVQHHNILIGDTSGMGSPSPDGKIVLFKSNTNDTDDLCSFRVDVNKIGVILEDASAMSPMHEIGATKHDYATNTNNILEGYDASCDVSGLSTGLQKIYFNDDMTKADTMHISTDYNQIIAVVPTEAYTVKWTTPNNTTYELSTFTTNIDTNQMLAHMGVSDAEVKSIEII